MVCSVARFGLSFGAAFHIHVYVQIILGSIMVAEWSPFGHLLGNICSLNLPYILFVSSISICYFSISHLGSRAEFWFWLCQFLVIAYFLLLSSMMMLLRSKGAIITLQEMCCVLWFSRERWYRKSALPSTGAG